jgi:aspartyl protease family protein
VKLLVDTGSSYTILPFEILEAIGCNPSSAKEKIRIGTANGYIIAPAVRVEWLHCLGHRINDFRVVAHTLPFGVFTLCLLEFSLMVC